MKIRLVSAFVAILVLLTATYSYAEGLTPRADLVFQDANAILCSGKYVVFTASTYDVADSISVTSVRLEKKVNGEWSTDRDLPCPSAQNDCIQYTSTVYYTSAISTGTYRIVVTFCADGHSITRTSNERTY